MKPLPIDELVLLPEPLALQRQFDDKNYRIFRWLWIGVAFALLVGVGTSLEANRPVHLVLYALDLAVTAVLFASRRGERFARHFRQILIVWLFLQLVMLKLAGTRAEDGAPHFSMFLLILVFFRLRLTEHLVLFGAAWIAALLPSAWVGLPTEGGPIGAENVTVLSVMTAVFLGLAALLTQLEKRRFVSVWRREHARSRERLRMREEIEYARKIQLSMLPQAPPEMGWIELAGASLPATEVGGDYYDYFGLSPSRLAIVIGDVAGHGLASGLLLSGVRSCLYLMEEDLGFPGAVLEKLNLMVRRTTDRRTYVTLLCAVLDREAGTLTSPPPAIRRCWSTGKRPGASRRWAMARRRSALFSRRASWRSAARSLRVTSSSSIPTV